VISTADAERSVDWLRDNARAIGQARAERMYLEQWVKSVRAECMQKHRDLPVNAQEREALTDTKYLAALQAFKEAVANDEHMRFLAVAAEAKLECWRTQESTRRAEGKAYS
jgi:hypothetical protein